MDYLQSFLMRKYGSAAKRHHRKIASGSAPTRSRFKAKNIKGYHLPVETAVIVPSTTAGDKQITKKQFSQRIEQTRSKLSKLYGGYTSVSGVGGYYSDDKKKLIKERTVTVTSYAKKEAYRKNKAKWLAWVRNKKKAWGQESIGIIVENDMYYV